MFAEKLSNPFLKPSPFLNANPPSTNAYNPTIPSTSRYNNFSKNSYEQPKLSNYPSFRSNLCQNNDTSYSSKPREQGSFGQISINNPFNRPSNGLFLNSTLNPDKSPNKYGSSWNNNISPKPTSYGNKDSYNNYPKNYQVYIPEHENNIYPSKISQEKPLTQRKYDNYLSGSSAESAETYINRIYQLDTDKSVENGVNPISNPFFRKSLMPDRIEEKQVKFKNSYDSAALKYSYQSDQKLDKPLNQNRYLQQQSHQKYNYQGKTSRQATQNPKSNYYKQKYENYDYKKLLQNTEKYEFSKYEKEDKYSLNPLINPVQEESKYKKYYEGLVEDDYSAKPKNNIRELKINQEQHKYPYSKYEKDADKMISKYDDPLDKNANFDFDAEDDLEKKQKYSGKSTELIKIPYDRPIYPDNKGSQKSIGQPSHKFNERVNFQQESNHSSKAANFGAHQGPFQTLGKLNKNSDSWDHRESFKFKHSEVQQYQYPKQIQDKVKSSKNVDYEYLKQQKNKPKSMNKIVNFSDNEQDDSEPPVNEATSQKLGENYPSVVQIGGRRFYKIEID